MSEPVEIQVKVPVCVTLRLDRDKAESMYLDQLCEIVDRVLSDVSARCSDKQFDSTVGGSMVCDPDSGATVEYDIDRNWDHLPEDDCELTMTEEGLFPSRAD